MRNRSLAMLALLGLTAADARAADLGYDYLRGAEYDEPAVVTTPLIDWSGTYVGGHGGYTNAALGFKNVFQQMIYRDSHDTAGESTFGASTLLNARSQRIDGASYGAFAGFNVQYGDVVFGLEGDYTWFGRTGTSSDSLGRIKTTADGNLESVRLTGTSTTRIEDYGTVRGRVGYAYGSFLPYVTGGLAFGRMQINDNTSYRNFGYNLTTYNANRALTTGQPAYVTNFGYASFSQTNPDGSTPYTSYQSERRSKVVAGFALGAGLEYALTSNIILRGEYQYALFSDFGGHKANLSTIRGGAAVKF
ncbi:Outer membrane protein A [Methylobacterium gregans]|uniref:Outer membrane protein A n=1 Tax=Methylobacterium gregans TaxID=374424 RepID=A0AA37MFR2_9HYPH|nr:outer membrane beta-barrel protein [Methylobacterium gregans]MDQ0520857.1 opacity protein-like surface antigen [Methylobacterium gregans]GJD81303.1 Outer membrane protein A [Methylobacterium gregans]